MVNYNFKYKLSNVSNSANYAKLIQTMFKKLNLGNKIFINYTIVYLKFKIILLNVLDNKAR